MSFPAYSAYRDSGVEWLGEVPEHWGVKQLRYLGRFRKGLTITKADLADTGIPCLNYGEVHSLYPFEVNQDIQPLKSVPVEYLETDPSACVKYGDFVFADTSEDLDGVGNFTHVSGMEPLFSGYHTIIYSLDSEVSSRFLAYCLDSFAFRTQLRMGVKGVKVFSVTQEILRGGTAWLPTTAEQTQIARFLDHETARIDALIEEQQRLIELLKEKRQAVISHAVTKGLDPTVPMKDSGVEWLGEVPAHWTVAPVKFFFEFLDGQRIPIKAEDRGAMQGDYPYYGASGIIDYVNDFIFEEDLVLVSEDGANLLMRSTPIAFVARGKYWVNNHAHIIRPQDENLTYWAEVIEQQDLTNYVTGSAQPKLTAEALGSIKIAVPPTGSERAAIQAFILKRDADLGALLSEAASGVRLLQERRSALISAAVTGKIDVRNW